MSPARQRSSVAIGQIHLPAGFSPEPSVLKAASTPQINSFISPKSIGSPKRDLCQKIPSNRCFSAVFSPQNTGSSGCLANRTQSEALQSDRRFTSLPPGRSGPLHRSAAVELPEAFGLSSQKLSTNGLLRGKMKTQMSGAFLGWLDFSIHFLKNKQHLYCVSFGPERFLTHYQVDPTIRLQTHPVESP